MLKLLIERRKRDERGAIAMMYALLLLFILVPVGALAVDLGNAVSRRTVTQTQADFAAYAGADYLNGTEAAGSTISTDVLTAVVNSLNANQPQDDAAAKATCWRSKTCVTSSQLTNGNLADGEVQMLSNGRLKVTAPGNRVAFGLAGAVGYNETTVTANATVVIKSAGLRVLPMFAVDGCDYGRQTLTDPAHVPAAAGVPTLADDTATNITGLNNTSGLLYDSGNNLVPNLTVNSTGNYITFIGGNKWKDTTKFGFFREGLALPVPETTSFTVPPSAANVSPYTDNANVRVRVAIPDVVAQTQAIWYVRAWSDTSNSNATNAWSAKSEAVPFRVGTPVLECVAGSVQGNFGTLLFPRNDVPPADNLPVNIMEGLQPPLTPDIHRTATASGKCTDGLNGAVESYEPNVLRNNTNCVDTDTGLTANVATQGFITGASGYTGLLTRGPTFSGTLASGASGSCSPDNDADERPVNLGPPGPPIYINDDILSCFLLPGKSLLSVSDETYAGGCAFEPELISSPRFIQVPVLKVQPGTGGSDRYSIIDYRPGFITDEVVASSTVKGTHTATVDNGLTIESSGITTIRVVFFARNAIESCGEVPLMDYLGVGQKIPVLTEVG
jgi:Flp pilus assembly protein TadG